MELKDTRNLHTSVEIGVIPVSERNDPKIIKFTIYYFHPKKMRPIQILGVKNAYKNKNIIFGSVFYFRLAKYLAVLRRKLGIFARTG